MVALTQPSPVGNFARPGDVARPLDTAALFALHYQSVTFDLPFYRTWAARADGPVLELGCGTGRVLGELVKNGLSVVGIDIDPAMLCWTASALKSVPGTERVWLVQADMKALPFGEFAGVVIAPLHAFQLMLSTEEQLGLLREVRRILRPGGRFVFDVEYPRASLLPTATGELKWLWTRPDVTGGYEVTCFQARRYDRDHDIMQMIFLYDIIDSASRIWRITRKVRHRFTSSSELTALLSQAGYRQIHLYGWYDGSPLVREGREIVVVAEV